MVSSTDLSKQQLKSKETKEKIYQAAKQIFQKKGYDSLSIKNICELAGVSNGSFYHHFKSKDDLLSYYIELQPAIHPRLLELPKQREDVKNAIVGVYLNYVDYCYELGVDFIASYYNPHNQALHPTLRTERDYPIVTVERYLQSAADAGVIETRISIPEIVNDIRMIVIGNAFEWGLRRGEIDYKQNMSRSISYYLEGVLK